MIGQLVVPLDAKHIRGKLTGQCGDISRPHANHQKTRLALAAEAQRLKQLPGRRRARDCLAARDGHHAVSKGKVFQGGIIDKGSPVDRFHRSQHAIIRDPLLTQAQDKSGGTEWIGDQVFHSSRSVRRNTSCVKST